MFYESSFWVLFFWLIEANMGGLITFCLMRIDSKADDINNNMLLIFHVDEQIEYRMFWYLFD